MTFEEKTIESQYIYEGNILKLRKDRVTTAKGKTGVREIVEHNGGVALAALKENGRMILVRQFRKALERVMLEVPAGKIEPGEKPEITALRELREETGYRAEKIEFLGKIYPSVGYTTETIYLYQCTGLTPGETDFDESEAIETEEYDLNELYEMALSGQIEDAKTLAAVLITWGRLQQSRGGGGEG